MQVLDFTDLQKSFTVLVLSLTKVVFGLAEWKKELAVGIFENDGIVIDINYVKNGLETSDRSEQYLQLIKNP